MDPSRPLPPLFDEDERAPLRAARDAIVRELERPAAAAFPFSRVCGVPGAADLAGGRAGLAVVFAHLGRREAALSHLDAALAAASENPFTARFFAGTCGTAWAAQHALARLGVADDGDDPVAGVDAALAALLDGGGRGPRPFDLAGGLVGPGVLALERLPRPGARALLDRVVLRLAERAGGGRHAAWWRTHPSGHVDLGMAHGVPGVVALLAGAHAAGHPDAGPLLERAVRWLLAQPPLAGPGLRYPKWRHADGSDGPASRQGWCYGAPGMACALLVAARATGNEAWRDAARDLARGAAATPAAACRIVDGGLCHGAAGVAHLYARLYRGTGCATLRDAARAWYGRLLALRREDEGIGGYRTWFPHEDHPEPWVDDAGLLTGAGGVALALHAAVAPDADPSWDRMLLVSGPAAADQPAWARAPARAARER